MTLILDGSNYFADADGSPAAAGVVTMACWFRAANVTGRHGLIAIYDGANYIGLAAGGDVASDPVLAVHYDGDEKYAATSSGYSADTWHHAAAVLTYTGATTRRAYIDGGNDAANSDDQDDATLTGLYLGYAGSALTGAIAWPAIWAAELTATEIARLAQGWHPLRVRPGSLVFFRDLRLSVVSGLSDAIGFALTGPAESYGAEPPKLHNPGRPAVGRSPVGPTIIFEPTRSRGFAGLGPKQPAPAVLDPPPMAAAIPSMPSPLEFPHTRARAFPGLGPKQPAPAVLVPPELPTVLVPAPPPRVRTRQYPGRGPKTPNPAIGPEQRGTHYAEARGKYRVFNDAEYRLYRDNAAPPVEGDPPFATASALPDTPADVYGDGTWFLSVSYFNGAIDSGFLPVGPNGETFLTLVIDAGAAQENPPNAPLDWRLEARAGGVVRIHAVYFQADALRAEQWSIAYTTDGGDPPADTPDLTQSFQGPGGVEILRYDLPAQAGGTTVKVRLQTRRNDGSDAVPDWVYSSGSTVLSIVAVDALPAAPLGGDRWPGEIPRTV